MNIQHHFNLKTSKLSIIIRLYFYILVRNFRFQDPKHFPMDSCRIQSPLERNGLFKPLNGLFFFLPFIHNKKMTFSFDGKSVFLNSNVQFSHLQLMPQHFLYIWLACRKTHLIPNTIAVLFIHGWLCHLIILFSFMNPFRFYAFCYQIIFTSFDNTS